MPMRMLNAGTLELVEFLNDDVPPYAILSHTWEKDEILFKDITSPNRKWTRKNSSRKVQGSCEQAMRDGLEWIWIDTCCIDNRSSAELSEAINSMFFWYSRAKVCYTYLSDVSSPTQDFKHSRWFTRGWTLQELIAPANVVFYNSAWCNIGTKNDLLQQISDVTGIDCEALKGVELDHFSVAKRMSWAAKRKTTRKEDEAYCLLGIFNINMPLLYGERDKAFLRLQQEIFRRSLDESLFTWGMPEDLRTIDPGETRDGPYGFQIKFTKEFFSELNPEQPKPLRLYGHFAASPVDFLHCGKIVHAQQNWPRKWTNYPYTFGDDLQLSLPVVHNGRIFNKYRAFITLLGCKIENTIAMICLLVLASQRGSPGRIRTPVTVYLNQWGPWSYHETHQTWFPLVCSNGFIDNKPHMSTIVIDTEQLCRTTRYRLTKSLCIPTASLTNSTNIQLSDSPEGRQSILLFETDKISSDPFIVIIGIFNNFIGNHMKIAARIRVQWVPRTHDPTQFMEKAIAQPILSDEVPARFGSFDVSKQIEYTVNAEGQLLDEVLIRQGQIGRHYGLNFWHADINLIPRSDQTELIIDCSIQDSLLSDLSGLHDEYLLVIKSIEKLRRGSKRVYWADDPYNYLSMFCPPDHPIFDPTDDEDTADLEALMKYFENVPNPPSRPKATKATTTKLSLDSTTTPLHHLKMKRKQESPFPISPWLKYQRKSRHEGIRLQAKPRVQSPKLKGATQMHSKIKLGRRKAKKTRMNGRNNGKASELDGND